MPKTAKLFANGRSQAVRLPQEFRFDGSEVYVRRDASTGDVILSRKPGDWDSFFALVDEAGPQPDFMAERTDPPPERDAVL
jgi:antitoxin VapB